MSKKEYSVPLSRLSCFAMVEDEGKAWFARLKANGLYEFDKIKNHPKLLMHFSDFPIDKGYLYLAIAKVGNDLILAPATASKIVIYDLATNTAEYVELMPVGNKRKVKYTGVLFFKCFGHGDSVYLFGFEYPAVLKINVKTKQIVYFTDWIKEVEKRIKKISVPMGYVSDYVWALCECANVVLCLDLRTDEIKIIDIYSDLDIRCGICFDGNFWVTGYNENANKLLKYDCSFMLEKEIEICSDRKDSDNYSFSLQNSLWEIYPIIDLGEKLLLFSVYPRHVYEFDKSSNEVQVCSVFEKLMEIQNEKLHDMGILAPRKKGDYVCFITGNDFLWNEYDFAHNVLSQYEVKIDEEGLLQKRLKFMAGRIFIEDGMLWNLGYKITLPNFLGHVPYIPRAETEDMGKENNVGVKVHKRYIKEGKSDEVIRRTDRENGL